MTPAGPLHTQITYPHLPNPAFAQVRVPVKDVRLLLLPQYPHLHLHLVTRARVDNCKAEMPINNNSLRGLAAMMMMGNGILSRTKEARAPQVNTSTHRANLNKRQASLNAHQQLTCNQSMP